MTNAVRNIVITGAGSGIGRALAVEASRRGMAVGLVGRREGALLETGAQMAPAPASFVLPADVTSPTGRRSIHERISTAWGALDILVNNAGIILAGPLAAADDVELLRLMTTNVVAPLALSRDLLPLLRLGKNPRIINMGSMLGEIPFPFFAAYSASKSAMRSMSAALRRELHGLGVGVTYAAPGAADTAAAHAVERFTAPFSVTLDRPATIAARILDAAEKGRDTIYPPGIARLHVLAEKLFPSLVDRTLRSQLDRNGGRYLGDPPSARAEPISQRGGGSLPP